MKRPEIKDSVVTLACRLLAAVFDAGQRLSHARPPAAPAKILVLKPCCLGDVLMSTPVVAALRQGYPTAQITFAVGGWSHLGLAGNPNVDAFVDCGPVGGGRYGLRDYLRLAQDLRRGRFDLALTLDRSPAIGLLPFLAGIPGRVGLDSGRRGFAHNVRVAVDWQNPKHETELYLDCVRALSLPVIDPALAFFPSAADREWAASFASASTAGSLVALHPGGAANPGMTLLAKRWNPRGFAAVADRIAEEYRADVVIVGAASDAEAAAAVCQAMRHQPHVLVGQTTLGQLAALYERCLLMLGNDSGVMHLAVAVGTPVVAVFGPSDPRVYGPYGRHCRAVRHDAQCSGRCFAPGRSIAVQCDQQCMTSLSVDEVWTAVQAVLDERGAG